MTPEVASGSAPTLTRAATATYNNRYGQLREAASGQLARAFPPNQKSIRIAGAEIMGLATNHITYSEEFEQWTESAGTVTDNAVIGPDERTSNAASWSMTSGDTLTAPMSGAASIFSIWLKVASGSETVRINCNSTTSDVTVTDSWQRLDVQGGSGTSILVQPQFTGTLYLFGAQAERSNDTTEGSYMNQFSRYIPTSGSTASSTADDLTIPADNFNGLGTGGSGTWDEGTISFWAIPYHSAPLIGGSNTNKRILSFNASAGPSIWQTEQSSTSKYRITTNSSTQDSSDINHVKFTPVHLVLRWNSAANRRTLFLDNSQIISATTSSLGLLNADLHIGRDRTSSGNENRKYYRGIVSFLRVWNQELSDAEVGDLYNAEKVYFGQ